MAIGVAEEIKRELIPELARLEIDIFKTLNKRFLADDADKIRPLMEEHEQITLRHNKMTDEAESNPLTTKKLDLYKQNITDTIHTLRDLHRRLDEDSEIFLKYDVPKLHSLQTLEAFMRIWRDEAERNRENGERSLIEWLNRLKNAEEKRETLAAMRLVAVNLGVEISSTLAPYFVLSAISAASSDELERKIQEVYVAIRSLRVDENPALIEMFLDTVRYADKTLRQFGVGGVTVINGAVALSDLLYLILREVLRLEVAFCCPDLPMMLTAEVFLGMGNYLITEVFEKRVRHVAKKAREVWEEFHRSVSDQDSVKYYIHALQVLEEGFQVIWNELEMKPIELRHVDEPNLDLNF